MTMISDTRPEDLQNMNFSQVVLIGRGMNESALRIELDRCTTAPSMLFAHP